METLAPTLRLACVLRDFLSWHNENEKSYKYVGCDTPSLRLEYRTFVRLSWKKTPFRAPATSQKRNFLRDFLQKANFLWTCVTKYCAKSTKKYDLILICILPFLYFPFLLCAFSVFSPRFTNASSPAVAAAPRGVSPGKLAQKRVLVEPGRCDVVGCRGMSWDVGTWIQWDMQRKHVFFFK